MIPHCGRLTKPVSSFILNFMEKLQEIHTFGTELVREYVPEYTFVIEPLRTGVYGMCRFVRKQVVMSKALALRGKDDHILNNILHEIAHALHPHQDHTPEWRETFLKIGGNGEKKSYYEGVFTKKPYKYQLRCTCGAQGRKYAVKPRLANNLHRYSCGRCSKMNSLFLAEL